MAASFQEQMPGNFCWGCGPDNPEGLHLASYWDGVTARAHFSPRPAFAAGPRHVVNGGIIATLLDCHAVCTAVADAYLHEQREIGSEPQLWYATAELAIEYLRPTPIDGVLELSAAVTRRGGRHSIVTCSLVAAGKERARATVRATRVGDEWRHGAPPPLA